MIAIIGILFEFLNHIWSTYVSRTTKYIFKACSYFREFPTTETPSNISRMETRLLAIVYIIAVVSTGMILIWAIYRKRKKGNVINIPSLLCGIFLYFCVKIIYLTAIAVLRVVFSYNKHRNHMMLYQPKILCQVVLTDSTESSYDLASSVDITSLCPRSILLDMGPKNHRTSHQPRKKCISVIYFEYMFVFWFSFLSSFRGVYFSGVFFKTQ